MSTEQGAGSCRVSAEFWKSTGGEGQNLAVNAYWKGIYAIDLKEIKPATPYPSTPLQYPFGVRFGVHFYAPPPTSTKLTGASPRPFPTHHRQLAPTRMPDREVREIEVMTCLHAPTAGR